MATNLFLFSLLFFSAFAFTISQKNDKYLCLQKIMPCSTFLKASNPPPTCCDPLKDAIANDAKCLCDLFNNKELLQTFNVTKDEALKLPKNCGLHADLGKCKADAGGTTPPSTPTPPTPTPPTPTPSTPTPTTPSKTPSTNSTSSSSNGLKATNAVATSVFITFGISYMVISF